MIGSSSRAGFSFDHGRHEYWDSRTGEQIPHITGMLTRTGWVDDTWYTEESRERGSIVHWLCTQYDLGALDHDIATYRGSVEAGDPLPYAGYLLAYDAFTKAVRPQWNAIEIACVHPGFHFGGRPDRAGKIFGARCVLEIKTGGKEKAHLIQTALQAILLAGEGGLPAEHYVRYAVYLKPNGKAPLERFKDRGDFDKAYQVIKECCS